MKISNRKRTRSQIAELVDANIEITKQLEKMRDKIMTLEISDFTRRYPKGDVCVVSLKNSFGFSEPTIVYRTYWHRELVMIPLCQSSFDSTKIEAVIKTNYNIVYVEIKVDGRNCDMYYVIDLMSKTAIRIDAAAFSETNH